MTLEQRALLTKHWIWEDRYERPFWDAVHAGVRKMLEEEKKRKEETCSSG